MSLLSRLSSRETLFVALLFLLVLPLALWALVVVPAQEARSGALDALRVVQADYVWVAEQAQIYTALSEEQTDDGLPAAGIAGLEAALIQSELRDDVTVLEAMPDGGIRLQLGAVQFDRLGQFLDTVMRRFGYDINALIISPVAEAGRIDASIGFTPHQP